MNPGLVGVALAVAATAPLMGLFLPPLYEVRSGQTAIEPTGFRHTAALGAALSVGVALIASAATGTPLPVVGTIVAVALIYGIYEWALRNPVGA